MQQQQAMAREHIHFVTGRLAERALRSVVEPLAADVGFDYSVGVMPITVAALMTPGWIARHVAPPDSATQILLPGYCDGDNEALSQRVTIPVQVGPRDLRQLPEYFGRSLGPRQDYGDWDIEILAEINHAPRLPLDAIRSEARRLADSGADVIDVGCLPGDSWSAVGDCVRALRDDGHRVSIDSFDRTEVELAVRAGAELVLSVNSSNCDSAGDWGCSVVAIPDNPGTLAGLDETVQRLTAAGIPVRIDPILEPIGCGFSASLRRYQQVRERYPDAEMMMGIGNLTELTDADSAGINVLLLGICQELGIRTVLTTQVINWARTSVRECDLARRLVHYACKHNVPPKHVEPNLVTLRDAKAHAFGCEHLKLLAQQIKDNNYRIFAEGGLLHLLCAGRHLTSRNAFELFDQLMATQPKNVDVSHAFYLGYEMAKAATALTLGKDYRQDEALDWGYLTVPEESHRTKRR